LFGSVAIFSVTRLNVDKGIAVDIKKWMPAESGELIPVKNYAFAWKSAEKYLVIKGRLLKTREAILVSYVRGKDEEGDERREE
jgi:hypothetical protein